MGSINAVRVRQREEGKRVPPLREIRHAQGKSLIDLETDTGLDRGHISRIERGQVSLSVDVLVRLARA